MVQTALPQWKASRPTDRRPEMDIEAVDEHLLYRHSVQGVYGKEQKVRRGILTTLRNVLLKEGPS